MLSDDAVAITATRHIELLERQATGAKIIANPDSIMPVVLWPDPLSLDDLKQPSQTSEGRRIAAHHRYITVIPAIERFTVDIG